MKLTISKLKQLIREELAKNISFTSVYDQGIDLKFDEYVEHYGFFTSRRLWVCINSKYPNLSQDQLIDKFNKFFDILQAPLEQGRTSLEQSMVAGKVPVDANLTVCLAKDDPKWYTKTIRQAGPIRRQA